MQDIEKLNTVSEEVPHGKGSKMSLLDGSAKSKQISTLKVSLKTQQNSDIWSAVRCHLGLPIDAKDVEIKLAKLLLFEAGGHFNQIIINSKQNGIFKVLTCFIHYFKWCFSFLYRNICYSCSAVTC